MWEEDSRSSDITRRNNNVKKVSATRHCSKVDLTKQYSISEAVAIAKECATAKFDESLDSMFVSALIPVMLTSR